MGKITHRYKDAKIHLNGNQIADIETGEIIKVGNSTLIMRTSTKQVSIDSKKYYYTDAEMLSKLLKEGIRQIDLALLISLSANLLTGFNICLDENDRPFKTSTIASLVKNSHQATKIKLNRLVDLGLLYYGILRVKKIYGKVYILNPHLIRKGRNQSRELLNLFPGN
jgi:hypothetical protein